MIIRKTVCEENRRVNELFAIAFELPMEQGPADESDQGCCHWAAFDEDGAMMSTFTVSDFQIRFDGNACKMGGIGGVATLPQYRRRGGIRGCFQAALPQMYADGYDFSYLYPFSTAYYRKFGYECCVQKYDVTVDLGLLTPPATDGCFSMAEPERPLVEQVKAIDRVWEEIYNMAVIHRDQDYDWLRKTDPAVRQEFTYVWFYKDGTPKAYTTFKKADQPDGRNLVCSRFCFCDRDGFAGLMQIFKSLSADHRLVKFSLPKCDGMLYLMPEWSMGAASWTVNRAGMVRVVNAAQVLQKAAYLGSGSLTLAIRDPQIPENSDVFTVVFANGAAVEVFRTDEAPDARMDISTFSALLSGVCDFESAAQWMNGLEILHPQAPFAQVFYPKPLMISDYF